MCGCTSVNSASTRPLTTVTFVITSAANTQERGHINVHSARVNSPPPPSLYCDHVRIHSDERAFQCSICGAAFKIKNTLNQHMRRHKGEKNCVCDHCGAKFLWKNELARHMRTHMEVKPKLYKCERCGKMFGAASSLSKHMNLHTFHKQYQCHTCGQCFLRRDYCMTHMQKCHPNLDEKSHSNMGAGQ